MFPFIAEQACQPKLEADLATFRLNLQDIYQCMVTKVLDKATVSIFTLSATFYNYSNATSKCEIGNFSKIFLFEILNSQDSHFDQV